MDRKATALQILEKGGYFRVAPGRFANAPQCTLFDATGSRVRGVGAAALWGIVTERGLYVSDAPRQALIYRMPRNEREAGLIVRKVY